MSKRRVKQESPCEEDDGCDRCLAKRERWAADNLNRAPVAPMSKPMPAHHREVLVPRAYLLTCGYGALRRIPNEPGVMS